MQTRHFISLALLTGMALLTGCSTTSIKELEASNPLMPVPSSPLGIPQKLSSLPDPPTSARVRLGRWLFFDERLSGDGTISCASCHQPGHAFSEPTPVSTGIEGQKGQRKAPPIINMAWTIFPNFFWDGRASSLEEQALGPIENPIEMGNTHENVVATLKKIPGYARYFKQAFGTEEITIQRVAKAIADYERTRLSGNSAWDRWQQGDEKAVTAEVKLGHELFHGKAQCNNCHLGSNFTDSRFHNLGVGWNVKTKSFSDQGRFQVTKKKEDLGGFKTPTLRDVSTHAPYMHDGSISTLRDVIDLYDKGGERNPWISPKLQPLKLQENEKVALVKFMESLDGEGYQDTEPRHFP